MIPNFQAIIEQRSNQDVDNSRRPQTYGVLLMVLLSRKFLTFDFIPLQGGESSQEA